MAVHDGAAQHRHRRRRAGCGRHRHSLGRAYSANYTALPLPANCRLAIAAALEARGERAKRKTVLAPESAHGTNPATAAALGFTVKPIQANERGRVDLRAGPSLRPARPGDRPPRPPRRAHPHRLHRHARPHLGSTPGEPPPAGGVRDGGARTGRRLPGRDRHPRRPRHHRLRVPAPRRPHQHLAGGELGRAVGRPRLDHPHRDRGHRRRRSLAPRRWAPGQPDDDRPPHLRRCQQPSALGGGRR